MLKIESIFSIVGVFNKMEYAFENKAVLEVLEKLVIAVTNLLIYYLIVKVSYTKPLLITKLMFISIKFEVPGEASCTYDNSAKPEKKTRLN